MANVKKDADYYCDCCGTHKEGVAQEVGEAGSGVYRYTEDSGCVERGSLCCGKPMRRIQANG